MENREPLGEGGVQKGMTGVPEGGGGRRRDSSWGMK